MARSQWHKFYTSSIQAPAELLFRLLSDLPNYGDWLPGSAAYGQTTDVEPYPVRAVAGTTTGSRASRARTGGER